MKRILFIFLKLSFLIVFFSCSTPEAGKNNTNNTNKRAQALEDLGNAYMQEGKLQDGLEILLEAYKINPDSPNLNHKIALIYREMGRYDLSLTFFQKTLALQPRFPEVQNNLGTLYYLMGKWDLALEYFGKAAMDVLYKTPHFAYNNIGLIHHGMGRFQEAVINYKKALNHFPTFAVCYKNLGVSYEAMGKNQEAINAYQDAINFSAANEAEYEMSHFLIGRIYLKTGRKNEAKEMLTKAIDLDPKAPYVEEARKLLSSIKP